MHVLGIDAGGTKTLCLLADAQGRIVAEARGPGANLHVAGEAGVEATLRDVITRTLGDRAIRAIADAICPGSRVLVVNDALIALVAGAHDAPGIVIIAGTGSITYGR